MPVGDTGIRNLIRSIPKSIRTSSTAISRRRAFHGTTYITSARSRSSRSIGPTCLLFPSRCNHTTPMATTTDATAEEIANTSGITPETLSQTLKEKLDATYVDIQDISGGCGASFTALIVSPQFQGKAILARHRLVNSALKKEIASIHAWTPKCLTPEQWETQQAQSQ